MSQSEGLKVLSEELVYKRYIRVIDRTVAFPPDGRPVKWDVATSANFVTILPYHKEDETVTLIKEWCQGPNQMRWSLPGGQYDPKKSSSKLDAAKAELSEEARLHKGTWVNLLSPSYSEDDETHPGIPELKWVTNLFIPFLVIDPEEDLQPGPRDDEELIEIHRIPLQEAVEIILKGEMMLPSAQAIWMAARYLREHNLLSKPIVL